MDKTIFKKAHVEINARREKQLSENSPKQEAAPKHTDHEHATIEAQVRLDAIDKTIAEIRQTAHESQLVARESRDESVRQGVEITGIANWQKRQNGEISSMVISFNNLSVSVNDKLDGLKLQIDKLHTAHSNEIERICDQYDEKIEAVTINSLKQTASDRDTFQRWLIAIMGTIIAGLIITVVSIRFGF
jgi:tetrahydromethanopterin S-methyltransferase subunit F